MPAANPRITITLQPEVHAILRRMSELTGNSQSSFVGELLAESMPIFERMVQVLEAAAKLQAEADAGKASLREGLAQAQEQLERQLGLSLETMDQGFRPILDEAEKVARRRGRAKAQPRTAAKRAGSTPMSNRGVTPHPTGPQKAKTGKLKGGR